MNKTTFLLQLSIVILSVSSMLATGQQPRARPIPPQTAPEDSRIQTQPLDVFSLAEFFNVHGWTFDLPASGNQDRFCYRLAAYIDGKAAGQTAWKVDSTTWGRDKNQRFTIVLGDVEEGIKILIRTNSAVIRSTIKIDTKMRANYFLQTPKRNKDGSVTLAYLPKDDLHDDSVIAPSSGRMVVVLETKEESEQEGAGIPDAKPADKPTVNESP